MGKIIRNGIEYCGTSDTADNIIYDNKDSGLAATNTQTAIDELSEKVKSDGNIVYLTQAEYAALPDSKLTDDVEYRITDAYTSKKLEAKDITYGESNVQVAIDGLNDNVDELNENIENLNASLGGLHFGIDGDGNYGYYGADGSLIPFSVGDDGGKVEFIQLCHNIFRTNTGTGNVSFSGTIPITLSQGKHTLMCLMKNYRGDVNLYTVSKNISIDGYSMSVEYDPKDYYGTLLKSIDIELNEEITIDVNFEGINYINREHYEDYLCFVFDYKKTSAESAGEIEIIPLVPTLTSNTGSDGGEVFASSINGSGWEAYKAFDGSNLTGESCWIGATNSDPQWIGYKFTVPTIVKNFTVANRNFTQNVAIKEFTLQGSNDNSTWIDIKSFTTPEEASGQAYEQKLDVSENDTAYLYYRVYIASHYGVYAAIGELQFYGYKMEALILPMVTNTDPSGEASASSETGGGYGYAYNAFNEHDGVAWLGYSKQENWLAYKFDKPAKVKFMSILNSDDVDGSGVAIAVKDFILQGSNNGTAWTDIKSFTNGNKASTRYFFDISENNTFYSHYRVYMNSYYHGSYIYVDAIQFYAAPEVTVADSDIELKTIVRNTNIATSHSFNVEIGKTYMLMFTGRADLNTDHITVTGGERLFYEVAAEAQATTSMTPRICVAKATESTMTFDATSINIFYPVLICMN